MNKRALVEYVRTSILKREPMADDQLHVHFKRVEQGVGYAFDTLLAQVRMNESGKAQIEEYFVKHYYNQHVRESNDYRYVAVLDDFVPVGEGMGIWYVQPSGGGKPLSCSKRPSTALFRSLPYGEAMDETVWRLGNISDRRQIVLENIGDSPLTDIRRIDYGIVRAFSSYGETEEVRVPDGRYDVLIQMVLQWTGNVYTDLSNNNV